MYAYYVYTYPMHCPNYYSFTIYNYSSNINHCTEQEQELITGQDNCTAKDNDMHAYTIHNYNVDYKLLVYTKTYHCEFF